MEKGTANTLMVFFKYPEKGHVKTRLAEEVGEDEALLIYKALLKYTIGAIRGFKGAEVLLYYSCAERGTKPKMKVPKGWKLVEQTGGHLGERFHAAFETALKERPGKAVVIGTDCIGLDVKTLEMAFDLLDRSDVVVGPSEDGGFYLLGFKDPGLARVLFENVPWGSNKAYERTLGNIKGANLSARKLPWLYDVDRKKEWLKAVHEEGELLEIFSALKREEKERSASEGSGGHD